MDGKLRLVLFGRELKFPEGLFGVSESDHYFTASAERSQTSALNLFL